MAPATAVPEAKDLNEAQEVAGLLLDVVPEAMRKIRTHLRHAAQGEITHPQLRILAHVRKGTDTAAGLAERQGVSPVAISKMVDALASKGLVVRTYREGNRKQVFLRLTAEGEKLYLRFRKAAQKAIGAELAQAEAAQRRKIQLGLEVLQQLLKR